MRLCKIDQAVSKSGGEIRRTKASGRSAIVWVAR
jgi:hypothetical protein